MNLSLEGKTILVTREKKQADIFAKMIVQEGGTPVVIPLLKIVCREEEKNRHIFQQLPSYDWIFFTSANGVFCFFQLLEKYHADINPLAKLAAVGHKTEAVLIKHGYTVDFVPSVYDAEHMANEFLPQHKVNGRVLLVRGNLSRDVLPNYFTNEDIFFDILEVYETKHNTSKKELLNETLATKKLDYLTFTSPSTVDAFMKMASRANQKKHLHNTTCVCIGTTTERRAKELGFETIKSPAQFTIEEMIKLMSK